MRSDAAVFSVVLFLVVASVGFFSLTERGSGQGLATSASGFETPVSPGYFIDGIQQTSDICLQIPAAGPTILNVTATFPWAGYSPSDLARPFVPIDYSFESFPRAGAVPKWLTLSMKPSSVEIPEGSTATSFLSIEVDASISNGTQGTFSLDAAYADPVSGLSGINVIPFQVSVSSSAVSVSVCHLG